VAVSSHLAGRDVRVEQQVVLGSYAGGARPTDREWSTKFVHVCDVAYGRITRFRVFFDTATFLVAQRRHGRDRLVAVPTARCSYTMS
jgi:ketosteroid isomerase-like protein